MKNCNNCKFGKKGFVISPTIIPVCSLIADTAKKDTNGQWRAKLSPFYKEWDKRSSGNNLGRCVGSWKRSELHYFRENNSGDCPFYKRKWWKFWIQP